MPAEIVGEQKSCEAVETHLEKKKVEKKETKKVEKKPKGPCLKEDW